MFLLTLLTIGIGVYYFVSGYEQTNWQGRQREAARHAATTVGDFVRNARDAMQILGALGLDELSHNPDEMHHVLQVNRALLEIVYLDNQGHVLDKAAQDKVVLASIFTIPQSRWFLEARSGRFFLGEVQVSADNKPYLIMALPAANGGVLAARLYMQILWDVIANLRFGEEGNAYVLNGDGLLIAHTRPDYAIAHINLGGRAELAAILHGANTEISDTYINFEGANVVGVSHPVEGTDWVVITELPQSEAFSVSRRALAVLAGGLTIFGLLIMGVSSYYLRQMVIQPLENLRAGAERIGQGDLGYTLKITQLDEVGEVASTFNRMAQHLRDREEALRHAYDEMEMRVQERTAALAEANQDLRAEIDVRTRTEDALRDSIARIRLIADNLPALIAYVDADQYYRFVNKRFEEWYATNDMVGKDLRTVAGEAGYESIQAQVHAALAGVETVFEYSRRYPDGQLRHVQISYIPHFAPDRQVLGFFTLVQDLTAFKTAEEQVKASLEEKVVLLKEIHHRVKNNLQVISSLLYLQAEKVRDQQLREILQDSQNRVKSMALIHEKLYQAKDLARVDLGEYIRNLVSYLLRAHSTQKADVRLHIHAEDIFLGIDTAMPCGLIINELVSNALKHAFPNGKPGEVHIDLNTEQNSLFCLKVWDNGIGFPAEIDFQNTSSLGLQLVNTLVQQLDGAIELHRNGRTQFTIHFAEVK
jgi:PAS domain S-box-containing protein